MLSVWTPVLGAKYFSHCDYTGVLFLQKDVIFVNQNSDHLPVTLPE